MNIKVDYVNPFPNASDFTLDFDLLINGFNGAGKVKYGKELKGESKILKSICALSKKFDKPIISAFDTDNYGICKKSVGVFENGKLLGISDSSTVIENSDYLPGCGSKLYDLKICKMGILVEDDLFSFTLFKSLAVCGAEVIVCLTDFLKKDIHSILIRAYSFLLGVPIVLIFKDGCILTDVKGELLNDSADFVYTVLPTFEFVLKVTKTTSKNH